MPNLWEQAPLVNGARAQTANLWEQAPLVSTSQAEQPQPEGPQDFGIDWGGDVSAVRKAVGALPEDQQDAAWNQYGEQYVKREREGGYRPAPLAGVGLPFIGDLMDEGAAAVEAIPNLVTGGRVGGSYSENLAIQRARERAAEDASPNLNLANRLSTGIAAPLPFLSKGAGLVSNAVRGAIGGGVVGGAAGFGAGEGGLDNRLEGAANAAIPGAWLGGAIPVAGSAIAGITRPIRDAVAPRITQLRHGPEAAADQILASRINRSGQSPQQIIDDLDEGQRVAQFGPNSQATLNETIADTSDSMQRLTGSVYRAGGEAGNLTKGRLEARQRGVDNPYAQRPPNAPPEGQHEEVLDAFDRALQIRSSDSARTTERAIMAQQARDGKRLYDQARNNSEEFDLQPAIDGLALKMRDYPPEIAGALQKAINAVTRPVKAGSVAAETAATVRINRLVEDMDVALSRAKSPQQAQKIQEDFTLKLRRAQEDLGTVESANRVHSAQRAPVDNIKTFDPAKRSLDDMIDKAKRAGENNLARELTEFNHALLARVHGEDQAGNLTKNLAYKEARDTWGSAAENREAIDLGRKALNEGAEISLEQFNALSKGQQQLFRLGLRESLNRRLANNKSGSDATSLFQQKGVQDLLRAAIPRSNGKRAFSDRTARFGEYISRQQRANQTRQSVLGNSATAQRHQDDAELAGDALGQVWQKFQGSSSVANLAFQAVASGLQKAFAFRQDVALALAKRLLEADPAKRTAILRAAEKQMGRKEGSIRELMNEVAIRLGANQEGQ